MATSFKNSVAKPRVAPSVIAAGVVVFIAVAWAIVPGVFAPGDPASSGTTAPLLAPSSEHWFGTDAVGRDLYTRVVWGARQSLAGAPGAGLLALIHI